MAGLVAMGGGGIDQDPGADAGFEGVDCGLENAAFGVDAAEDEVGPALLLDQGSALFVEERVALLSMTIARLAASWSSSTMSVSGALVSFLHCIRLWNIDSGWFR